MQSMRAIDARVQLVPLNERKWRVCDARYGDGSRPIIGYLQHVDDRYEMLWMRPLPGVTHRYPTLEEAVHGVGVRLHSVL